MSAATLADHRGDNRAWVLAVMAGAVDGEHPGDDQDQAEDRAPARYVFELAKPDDPDVPPIQHRILRAISTRIRWRQALNAARQRDADRVSATQDPEPPAQAA